MPKASEKSIALAKDVLKKCIAYDPMFPTPTEAQVMAWAEHISIRNPDREDMLAAVTRFYEHNADGVKPLPAAISSIARQIRQEQSLHGDYEPPPDKSVDPAPPILPGQEKITLAEWEKRHGQKFPRLRIGRSIPEAEYQDDMPVNPLRAKCPHCKAAPGSPCTIPGTSNILTKHRCHPSRMDAACEQLDA